MLTKKSKDGVIEVSFNNVNRFNALIAEPVKIELKSFYSTPGTKLVLNLNGINFIDSTGFGVLLSIMKTANNNQGSFKISAISEEVMELFKLLQLHNVFEIYRDTEDAIKSYNN